MNYYFGRFFQMPIYKKEFNRINKKTVEIPLFENVMLHYIAEKDYSKQLEKIEIKEHPFKVVNKIGSKKQKANEYLWKALFTFSKIPRDGKLTVYFH